MAPAPTSNNQVRPSSSLGYLTPAEFRATLAPTITQGGPGSATTNLPYEIYLTAFRKYDYGEAAAAGVIVVIISIIVANFGMRLISSLVAIETGKKKQ